MEPIRIGDEVFFSAVPGPTWFLPRVVGNTSLCDPRACPRSAEMIGECGRGSSSNPHAPASTRAACSAARWDVPGSGCSFDSAFPMGGVMMCISVRLRSMITAGCCR